MTTAVVHESMEVQGLVGDLDVVIEHYTESRLNKIIQKIDRYSTLGAETAFKEGKSATIGGAFLRAFFTFVQDYFFHRGVLDGMPGLTLAVTDSVNKFFKYAKLSELIEINRGGEAPSTGAGGSPPKYDIPRIAERIQFPTGEEDVLRRGK